VRRTLRHELAVNPKVVVFGEDVGRKGGVHLVTEGLQKQFGADRVFDTSLSEEGIIGRASGLAISGLMPVAEIQFRKYADPATEQLNNTGTMRWRTNNRFAAPMVVRMPGGFGKDVGDPWHSLSDEVRFAHAYGWQVVMPSNASDAVGSAARRDAQPQPHDLLRASRAAHDRRRQRPLSRRRLRAAARPCAHGARGRRAHARDVGRDGASLHRCGRAVW
jgi:2-oxoisovalerate dehydrogenase E1 component